MDKLTELRNFVADLFSAATDKTTIEKSAIVNQKIKEIEDEQQTQEKAYQDLLKDYKEVVLHTSFKDNHTTADVPNSNDFNGDDFIKNYLKGE